jgi:hypothetical protein
MQVRVLLGEIKQEFAYWFDILASPERFAPVEVPADNVDCLPCLFTGFANSVEVGCGVYDKANLVGGLLPPAVFPCFQNVATDLVLRGWLIQKAALN